MCDDVRRMVESAVRPVTVPLLLALTLLLPARAHADGAGVIARDLPLVLADGRTARVTVVEVPAAPDRSEPEREGLAALNRVLRGLDPACLLSGQVVGAAEAGVEGDAGALGVHRLARERAEAVRTHLAARGLLAERIAAVWDYTLTYRARGALVWLFRLDPEDCAGGMPETAQLAAADPAGTDAPPPGDPSTASAATTAATGSSGAPDHADGRDDSGAGAGGPADVKRADAGQRTPQAVFARAGGTAAPEQAASTPPAASVPAGTGNGGTWTVAGAATARESGMAAAAAGPGGAPSAATGEEPARELQHGVVTATRPVSPAPTHVRAPAPSNGTAGVARPPQAAGPDGPTHRSGGDPTAVASAGTDAPVAGNEAYGPASGRGREVAATAEDVAGTRQASAHRQVPELRIVFDVNSSFLGPDNVKRLRSWLTSLPAGRWRAELAVAVGPAKGVRARSRKQAEAYERWLAERRAGRVRSQLERRLGARLVDVDVGFVADDPSRSVTVRLLPVEAGNAGAQARAGGMRTAPSGGEGAG